ncbi:MAG TPA: oligopeptide/dipeptide ABC transporter ATP-binding protein [Nevskiaceae bacterium]|nr:oligopeptide/dipeptide ABC transporter ATP-binding protein [Nevskiaceae bacterium]
MSDSPAGALAPSAAVADRSPLLVVRRLRIHFERRDLAWWRRPVSVKAVDGIDFNLRPGETLGIVGESGCGKSTLARALVGLQPVTSGAIEFEGRDLSRLDEKAFRPLRRQIQMIFQDPLASLDPRMTIGESIGEPLRALYPEIGKAEREARVRQWLDKVGLSAMLADRYPHEFSGGQCQRVGIARALIVQPRLLVCDEPVSALDVSVQAQILNLLADLQRELDLALLFIAHDLSVVRHLSHRVMVMYLGKVMEQAETEVLFRQPMHPYTRALMAAIPGFDPEQPPALLPGEPASPAQPPPGCVFVSRCPMADHPCNRSVPHLKRVASGAHAACHYLGAVGA